MEAIRVLDQRGADVPVTTVDLGREVAIDMAGGGRTVGIAAQQPYAQGLAVAQTTILSLLGLPVPGWTALPGVSVTTSNLVESYQMVWNTEAPDEVLKLKRGLS